MYNSTTHHPAEDDLGHGLPAVGAADGGQPLVLEELDGAGRPGPQPVGGAQRAEAGQHDGAVVAELAELLLGEVGVHLHLVGDGLDGAVVQDVLDLDAVEVGEADVLGQALLHQLLHGLPSGGGAQVLIPLNYEQGAN